MALPLSRGNEHWSRLNVFKPRSQDANAERKRLLISAMALVSRIPVQRIVGLSASVQSVLSKREEELLLSLDRDHMRH